MSDNQFNAQTSIPAPAISEPFSSSSQHTTQISAENSRDYEELSTNITRTVETLKGHLNHPNSVMLTESISNTIDELSKQAEYISEKQGRLGARRYMDAERDAEDLMRCYRHFDALLHRLNIDIGMTASRINNETLGAANRGLDISSTGPYVTSKTFKLMSEHLPDALLVGMAPVKEARYDASGTNIRRTECTPGTRVSLLEDLVKWANDEDGAKVYWMNGMAGTGKTTIACSLCYTLKSTNQLAASFFCSRQLPGCRDISRILPTLSYQLARLSPIFKDQLFQVLQDDPDICSVGVAKQFEMLINEPLRKVDQTVRADRLVIVIDALDECSDSFGAQMILDALFQFAADLPVKLFVTCRPEPTLFDRVSGEKRAIPSIFHLHNIEHSVIQADIETYLNAELAPIGVSDRQIKSLAERSGKLFIYAATAVQYIRPTNARVDPQSRLQTVLGVALKSSGKVHEQLDELYTTILSAALDNTALEPLEAANIKLVLHTVLCAREPMTIEALAYLLRLKSVKEARLALEPLGSVLCVSDIHLPVSTLHASFPDYMRDQERSKRYWFDPATHHGILSWQCFTAMKDLLQFNICGLESSFVLDMDVPDLPNRVEKAIPSHLFYACRHFKEHLVQSCNLNVHAPMLVEFLRDRVLFWMEVMSLKKCIGLAASILSEICGWMKRANVSGDAYALCLDAQRFASVFGASPAHTSTPHIYVSILALWNRDSAMWAQYGTWAKGLAVTEGPALNNRQSGPLVSWRTGGEITSAAVSHDGRCVVTSSKYRELHVWGAYTGTLLAGPFIGHTGAVLSVAFSPDDSRIASSSDDYTIRVWDARKGNLLGAPFEGHKSRVNSVVFSPDGGRLASSSDDCTIRIWDTQTGQTVAGPFQGHSGSVRPIAYAPDGSRIVSGSYDGTICLWNALTGRMVAGPLDGDGSSVLAIAFSAHSSHFASGSLSGAIHVWDAQTGQAVGKPFYECSAAFSVAFNPRSKHIVSGHEYGAICVWDMKIGRQDNEYCPGPEKALVVAYLPNDYHICSVFGDGSVCILDTRARQARSSATADKVGSPVYSVHFSPDSHRIASGCHNGTICIRDAHTGDIVVGPFQAHTNVVTSVAFSPGGGHIASGSYDDTVCIWDAQTGRRVVGPLEGHTNQVISVAYSPDGGRLVSGSRCAIHVWDLRTGRALASPFKGHTDWVRSVAYSSDGKRIVSGSDDKTVRVWDAYTGQAVIGPLTGHAGCVNSVVFSPNDSRILSASHDRTIHVWDAQTGHPVGEPFRGHTEAVCSVAYLPNGSQIVSSSRDYTVRVWDAETGRTVAGPFKTHTDWVRSVAYSPDGSCFASGSDDGTIRIWYSQSDSDDVDPLDNWTMNEDGWIVGDNSSLLCWVPQDLRPALLLPRNTVLIRSEGGLRLNFRDACIGPWWTGCFTQ